MITPSEMVPEPGSRGVYFLYRGHDEIVYIGKSENLYKRIEQHKKNKTCEFTHFSWIDMPGASDEDISITEAKLIDKHRPVGNKHLNMGLLNSESQWNLGWSNRESSALCGLYVLIDDEFQGQIIDVDGDVVLVELFSWADGSATEVRHFTKDKIYSGGVLMFRDRGRFIEAATSSAKSKYQQANKRETSVG